MTDLLDIDIRLLQDDASFADPIGNVEGAAPGQARVVKDDDERQDGDDEGDEGVEQRQIAGVEQAGVDQVAN